MPIISRKNDVKAKIKAKAGQIILTLAPEWKQRNIIARSIELTDMQATGQLLSVDEAAERSAIKALWSTVQQIRSHSDFLESEVDTGRAVDIESGWP